MIPVPIVLDGFSAGFPRVSGDDPFGMAIADEWHRFSLRERG